MLATNALSAARGRRKSLKTLVINGIKMVEAAGVEPASEKTSNREHSCFSAFRFVSSASLRTGEDAKPTSLIDLV